MSVMGDYKILNKKVYFNIRAVSRERMWDTTKYSRGTCEVLLPSGVEQQSSIKTYSSSNSSLMSKLKYEVSKNIINKQKIDNVRALESDLIYMWGAIPKNTKQEFIVELDNPYSLAYYHIENFHKQKEKIKENLRKSQKITYLSETCMNHSLELLGEEFKKKSFVNYPYMAENYKKNNRDKNSIINFIFVGLNSRGKGGNELLEAFTHTKEENIRLTFISNLNDHEKMKYKKDTRISILPPQPREKLLNEIYPKMDIMIFPSFYESFGVVLLEALSFGMGIITMNTYATPEIVQDNFNGRLLHHPILHPTILNGKDVINCVDFSRGFHERYLKNTEFYYGLYSELKSAIEESNSQYRTWQENSLKLFNNRFSPEIWQNNLKKILE